MNAGASVAVLATPPGIPQQCAGDWKHGPYRETLALKDGRSVLLRPAHHRDAPALQRLFAELSPRSRLLRFHGALKRLPDAAARSLRTQIAARHIALVALSPDAQDEPRLRAEARYAVDDDGEAEFGIAVADDWQGLGLGRALLTRLVVHARDSGLATLIGNVMPGNEAMLQLLRAFGAEIRSDAAEVQGRIRLR